MTKVRELTCLDCNAISGGSEASIEAGILAIAVLFGTIGGGISVALAGAYLGVDRHLALTMGSVGAHVGTIAFLGLYLSRQSQTIAESQIIAGSQSAIL